METHEINEMCEKMNLKDEKIMYLEQRIQNLEDELELIADYKSSETSARPSTVEQSHLQSLNEKDE
jgi:hypothetical protein